MSLIVGIDPNQRRTAVVVLHDHKIVTSEFVDNSEVFDWITPYLKDALFGIEAFKSQGKPVGQSVFETCYVLGMIAGYIKNNGGTFQLVHRNVLKKCIVERTIANDAQVSAKLREIYGGKGTKSNPGNTYHVVYDQWQALAVAHCIRMQPEFLSKPNEIVEFV